MATLSPDKERIRAPIVDGIFYPAQKTTLQALIHQLIRGSEVVPRRASAIISPHAAYEYCGSVAAAAFQAAAARTVEQVVLLGPVHREQVEAVLLPESHSFETPLGRVAVHQDILEELQTCSTKIIRNDISHLEEHCLEVQLPFIQYLFPQAKIVPVLMGAQSPQISSLLSKALQVTFSDKLDKTLFVISANMAPDLLNGKQESNPADFIERIRQQDWRGILNELSSGRHSSCAAGCIAAILALQDILGHCTEVLKEGNAAETTGDSDNLVHYAAIAISREHEGNGGFHTHRRREKDSS